MSEAPEPLIRIQFPKLICVEGKDEINFFEAFLKHIGIRDIQIFDVIGKSNFKLKLQALKATPNFYKADGTSFVSYMLLIRDKDTDFQATFDSVSTAVRAEGFVPPKEHGVLSNGMPKIGIFVMPGKTVEGVMLEDLCLKTVEARKEMTCVNDFVVCLKKQNREIKNIPKAKVQAYLAAQSEIVNSLGVGAQKNCWDFGSSSLDELKKFLELIR